MDPGIDLFTNEFQAWILGRKLRLDGRRVASVSCKDNHINLVQPRWREREIFYLTMHSTHFIYGYMVSDIWLRTILIVRKETRCRHIGYSFRLAARVLSYAPSHRQDNTYHSLCYTSHGALAGMRYSSMGPPHEGSIRRPIAPWANTLPLRYVPLPATMEERRRIGNISLKIRSTQSSFSYLVLDMW